MACLTPENGHAAAEIRDLRGLIDVWGACAMVGPGVFRPAQVVARSLYLICASGISTLS